MRSVQCVSHDAAGPRVVEDAVCAAYVEAPLALQTCNMQKCAEFRATRWSAVRGTTSLRLFIPYTTILYLLAYCQVSISQSLSAHEKTIAETLDNINNLLLLFKSFHKLLTFNETVGSKEFLG